MVAATMAANNGNQANPSVQIELAGDTRAQNGAVITDVLENASNDKEEEAAIKKIAGQV